MSARPLTPPEPPEAGRVTPRNPLNPKKLFNIKWTAVAPQRKEKHVLVIRVAQPEAPATRIETVELQAVHSKRLFLPHWRELQDAAA